MALGVILIIVSAVVIVVPNQMMPKLLKESLPLVKDSKVFESWKEPGKIPVTMEFYFFDIKNNLHTQASNESTETPIEHGGKPIVEEKGPYVYRETRVRSDITFNDDQTELGFSERTRFEFDAEASNGKEVRLPWAETFRANIQTIIRVWGRQNVVSLGQNIFKDKNQSCF